uniref:NADH-ubiquinone oxidoreductase chain 3 n=1 Tax=Ariosoma shiroanago TaxID=135220 RepID=D1YU29_ARISH|nr:NADH dehydrogenase subunit 3 [Ariosoma shiroanago]BAI53413.2 NADH dehydrogenase subunit 3 [Ariosoma shiroanago]
MNPIMPTLLITIALASLLAIIPFLLTKVKPSYDKLSPFECGFDPMGSTRLPFSMRFFLVGVLFLLFDLEIALLLPMPWGNQLFNVLQTFLWATVLILTLTLGLVYEWIQGGLEWAE